MITQPILNFKQIQQNQVVYRKKRGLIGKS
jgi:hypothetical protein